jgi:acyl carrier protein
MSTVSIHDVETALSAFPGLGGVAVTEHSWTHPGTCLVAYVTPGSIDVPALSAHARKSLPGHLVPAAIIAVDKIPATTDGSVSLADLPAPRVDGLMPYRPPRTDRQQVMCDNFADVLRVPRAGLDDDFFNLGGRSVDAMLLAVKIAAATGVSMSMTDLFDAPTVAELDQRLGEREQDRTRQA